MIKFQAKYLPSLCQFMGAKDIRYYLNGVHIEPHPDGGAILVATNGHMLLAIIDAEAECSAPALFSVNPDALKHCVKARYVHIHTQEQRLIVMDNTEQELYVQPRKCFIGMDEKHLYPDFRRVVPDFKKIQRTVASFINCNLLARIIKAHPNSGKRGTYPVVRFWQEPGAEKQPIVVQFDGAPEFMAVLMPIVGQAKHEIPAEWEKMCRPHALDGVPA